MAGGFRSIEAAGGVGAADPSSACAALRGASRTSGDVRARAARRRALRRADARRRGGDRAARRERRSRGFVGGGLGVVWRLDVKVADDVLESFSPARAVKWRCSPSWVPLCSDVERGVLKMAKKKRSKKKGGKKKAAKRGRRKAAKKTGKKKGKRRGKKKGAKKTGKKAGKKKRRRKKKAAAMPPMF
jgi:hypothetical protein